MLPKNDNKKPLQTIKKRLTAVIFGTPGWVRTSGLSLRRRPLYPTELRGLIQKIFNFRVQPDSNELPLRRRPLYPTELRGLIQKIFNFRVQPDSNELPLRRRTLYPAELRTHTTPGISVNEYARCVVPVVGLEPTRCCHQRILSPHRLPFRHTGM